MCAVLAGAKSFTAIAAWAHDLTPTVRYGLGLGRCAPCESTIRRVLQAIDATELDRVVSTWLAARAGPGQAMPVIAVDGKTARGARCGDERAVSAGGVGHRVRGRPGPAGGGRKDQRDQRV